MHFIVGIVQLFSLFFFLTYFMTWSLSTTLQQEVAACICAFLKRSKNLHIYCILNIHTIVCSLSGAKSRKCGFSFYLFFCNFFLCAFVILWFLSFYMWVSVDWSKKKEKMQKHKNEHTKACKKLRIAISLNKISTFLIAFLYCWYMAFERVTGWLMYYMMYDACIYVCMPKCFCYTEVDEFWTELSKL